MLSLLWLVAFDVQNGSSGPFGRSVCRPIFPLLQVGIEEMRGLVAASQGKSHNLALLREGQKEEEEEETFVHVYCLLRMF